MESVLSPLTSNATAMDSLPTLNAMFVKFDHPLPLRCWQDIFLALRTETKPTCGA